MFMTTIIQLRVVAGVTMMDESSSDEEDLVAQTCFSQEIVEPKSYTDCILDEIGDIVKFDTGIYEQKI